jgi:hypothetical protein
MKIRKIMEAIWARKVLKPSCGVICTEALPRRPALKKGQEPPPVPSRHIVDIENSRV